LLSATTHNGAKYRSKTVLLTSFFNSFKQSSHNSTGDNIASVVDDMETLPLKNVLEVELFSAQRYQKFDLRMTGSAQ
jgi:hypothetical protein